MEKPIYSSRAADADFDEAIDAFVVSLGERVDDLQDAEAAADRERVRRLAGQFAADAEELGYPTVADAARQIAASCDDVSDTLRKQIVDLTSLTQRVRRGHRSSA